VADILKVMGLDWSVLFGGRSSRPIDPVIQHRNDVMARFREWREHESRRLGEELRERDRLILAIDRSVADGTITESEGMDLLAPLYYRYNELEHQFDVLVKGRNADAMEIFRNGQR
jgi:hypothetical protein